MEPQEINARIRTSGTGDRAAFGDLVAEYGGLVYALSMEMMQDEDQAFELSEKIFLRAWHAISLYTYDLSFPVWLFRISMDEGMKLGKKLKKKNVPCSDKVELLVHGLAKELSVEENKALKEHLSHCPGCHAIYTTFLNHIDTQLNSDKTPGKRLQTAVEAAIGAEQKTSHPMQLLGRVRFTIFAIILIMLLLCWTKLRHDGPSKFQEASHSTAVEEVVQNTPAAVGGQWLPANPKE